MRRTARHLLVGFSVCLLASCNTATPENYFEIAVLNCNLMHGFAGPDLLRELESPSIKLTNAATGESAPMKRKEVIDDKIRFLDENLTKLRKLPPTKDTAELLRASLALYEYVLPVYRNQYRQLAALYDAGAPAEQIQSLAQLISQKYGPKFETLFDGLIALGKPYAERHHIPVKWET
jgi:hypothetical protein